MSVTALTMSTFNQHRRLHPPTISQSAGPELAFLPAILYGRFSDGGVAPSLSALGTRFDQQTGSLEFSGPSIASEVAIVQHKGGSSKLCPEVPT